MKQWGKVMAIKPLDFACWTKPFPWPMRVIFIVGKCPKYFESWANLRQELDHVFGCWMRDIYLGTPENELWSLWNKLLGQRIQSRNSHPSLPSWPGRNLLRFALPHKVGDFLWSNMHCFPTCFPNCPQSLLPLYIAARHVLVGLSLKLVSAWMLCF